MNRYVFLYILFGLILLPLFSLSGQNVKTEEMDGEEVFFA